MASSSEDQAPRQRGLPSIQQAREARASGKHRWPSVKFWGYSALVLMISAILHWKYTQGQVESAKTALLARQRAVAKELEPRWNPMRDKLEKWTTELAADAGAEAIDRDALKSFDFRDRTGIYLRLRVEDAKSAESIRKGARDSLRDAFTACLMRVPNQNPLAGKECKRTADCPQKEFCNENDHCARPAQPFNLRVAYRTMHVLSDDWVRDAQEASNDLRIRLLTATFDGTIRDDIPLAAELLQNAQYYLVVLDEDAKGADKPDANAGVSAAEALQTVPHWARIGVWRLSDGKPLLRIRREASGQLLGATPQLDPEVMDARQRQANSCSLALAVREAMGDTAAAATPPAP
ncbi:MAG: hypothetical protein U0359_06785 [Byssovorax sp.]